MLYFRTITFEHIEGQLVEKAIRQYTVKRHTPLDLQSSATYIGTEKLFLGRENEKSIQLTRIRSPFERLLPRLIISFDNQATFTQYKIRYSLLSNIAFIFLASALIANIIYWLSGYPDENGIIPVLLLFAIFLFLTSLELRFTKSRLKTAIDRVTQAGF